LAEAQAVRLPHCKECWHRGGVTISQVGIDKCGGCVDAIIAVRDIADVSAALLSGGFAGGYAGGRRAGCG